MGTISFQASSDLLRLELLHCYGGVWVDATTICTRSLDEWLPEVLTSGFFAYNRPGPDRLLSTWFLAAEIGSYIVERWRNAAHYYWKGRDAPDDYFWVHKLFLHCYQTDPQFRAIWNSAPKRSAAHSYHFGPESLSLLQPPTLTYSQHATPPEPVIKLTHKLPPFDEASLMAALCRFGRGPEPQQNKTQLKSRRILVGWYGSFRGHGTIGDLRSLEVVIHNLVGAGHSVLHATATILDFPGAQRVDWETVDPSQIDAVVFVCGPILGSHPQTSQFFFRFSSTRLAGVGVSLLSKEDSEYVNPFDAIFARQGGPVDLEDLAVLAPISLLRPINSLRREKVIGICLRGPQSEYGNSRCLWREVELAAENIVNAAREVGTTHVINLDNHLLRSGYSAEAIEELYLSCDLIVTSRFHGGVMAMRQRVPFIAIDQITGGGKVYPLMVRWGWPYIYKISETTASTLNQSALSLLSDPERDRLSTSFCRAVEGANYTLSYLHAWVASIPDHCNAAGDVSSS